MDQRRDAEEGMESQGLDRKTFIRLLVRYRSMVIACGRRMGIGTDQMDDFVGDTFAKAYVGLPGFSGSCALATWLWAIAYRQAITQIRRNQVRAMALARGDLTGPDTEEPCPSHQAQSREQVHRLRQAMHGLPKTWATAIHLYYWQDQSTTQVARHMRVSDGAVRLYLSRGRLRLRALLAD